MKTLLPIRPFSSTLRLAAAVGVINAAAISIVASSLYLSRIHHDQQAASLTRNIAEVLDQSISGDIRRADIALLSIADEAERQLRAGGIDRESLSRFIMRAHERMPELVAMRATDAAGSAIYGAPVKAVTTSSLAHRNYFTKLRDNPGAALAVSEPLVGGISGKWMIVLARRISNPDGSFAGLVYGGCSIERFTNLFSRIDMGRRTSVSLYTDSFTIVARYEEGRDLSALTGKTINPLTLSSMLKAGMHSGTYEAKSVVDGVDRMFSFTKVTVADNLVIVAGVAKADYLRNWRREIAYMSVFTLIFLLMSACSGFLIRWEWLHREAAVKERMKAVTELEESLARTKRLEGFISICMHCKKIHNGHDSWEQLEKYISEHSDAQFSHGICPECYSKHYHGIKNKNQNS